MKVLDQLIRIEFIVAIVYYYKQDHLLVCSVAWQTAEGAASHC